jgi:hypothetical protein
MHDISPLARPRVFVAEAEARHRCGRTLFPKDLATAARTSEPLVSCPPQLDQRSYARRPTPCSAARATPDDCEACALENRFARRRPTKRAEKSGPGRSPPRANPPGPGECAAGGWGAGQPRRAPLPRLPASWLAGGGSVCAPLGSSKRPWAGGTRGPTPAPCATGQMAPTPGPPLAPSNQRGPPGPVTACGLFAWGRDGQGRADTPRRLQWRPLRRGIGLRPGRTSAAPRQQSRTDAA